MHVKIKHLDIFELCVEVPAVESHPIARVHRSEQLTTLPLCVTSYLDLTRNVHEVALLSTMPCSRSKNITLSLFQACDTSTSFYLKIEKAYVIVYFFMDSW